MERLILGHSMALRFLRNDEHIKFYDLLSEDQAKNIVSILLLRAPFELVRNLMEEEREINRREKRTVKTKKIKEAAQRRLRAMLHIKLLAEAHLYGTDLHAQQAASAIRSNVIGKHRAILKNKLEEQTRQCEMIIADLRSPAYAQAVQALNLAPALSELVASHDSFNDLYAAIKKTVKNKGIANIRLVRGELDVAFTKLTDTIDMLYKINEMGSREAVLQSRLATIINAINDHIFRAATKLSKRGLRYGKLPSEPVPLPLSAVSASHKTQE
ncbi:MAG: DUF6261 family protein [Tannerellaceae bacterium]|jgi:hypothetical protein|nr:DUF6261 family protein [Tannerellaceae bacterium]